MVGRVTTSSGGYICFWCAASVSVTADDSARPAIGDFLTIFISYLILKIGNMAEKALTKFSQKD